MADIDQKVRIAAFNWLDEQVGIHGDVFPRSILAQGFEFEGQRVPLVAPQGFDEKLRHYADLRISLDLDDGVKVNYCKFGDLLAEVKAVTGKKPN
jgi:hypothetical protein